MRARVKVLSISFFAVVVAHFVIASAHPIGQEHALPRHLADGEEFTLSPYVLIDWGSRMFQANWTIQDGAGGGRATASRVRMQIPVWVVIMPRTAFPEARVTSPQASSFWGSDSISSPLTVVMSCLRAAR